MEIRSIKADTEIIQSTLIANKIQKSRDFRWPGFVLDLKNVSRKSKIILLKKLKYDLKMILKLINLIASLKKFRKKGLLS
jgi:hypothetical protein